MKKILILALLLCVPPSLSAADNGEMKCLREGVFALALAQTISFEVTGEENAARRLSGVGVAPVKGWRLKEFLTGKTVSQVHDALTAAVADGRVASGQQEAVATTLRLLPNAEECRGEYFSYLVNRGGLQGPGSSGLGNRGVSRPVEAAAVGVREPDGAAPPLPEEEVAAQTDPDIHPPDDPPTPISPHTPDPPDPDEEDDIHDFSRTDTGRDRLLLGGK
jgi:hypothetical protein